MLRKPRKKAMHEPPMVVPAEQAAEVFPAVRYFQIHFEFLQEQMQLILSNQESLRQQLQQFERRLPRTGQGVRQNIQATSPLECLATGHVATQDSDKPILNLTGGQ